jgi:hypothetical protein
MLQVGSIYHIKDFDFSSMNPALNGVEKLRDKYVLVLNIDDPKKALFCFTTTFKTHPSYHMHASAGCNYIPHVVKFKVYHFEFEAKFHCFDTRYRFPEMTYIVGNKGQVFESDLPFLFTEHNVTQQIVRIGAFDIDTLFEIIECIHDSKSIETYLRNKLHSAGSIIYSEIQKRDTPEEKTA